MIKKKEREKRKEKETFSFPNFPMGRSIIPKRSIYYFRVNESLNIYSNISFQMCEIKWLQQDYSMNWIGVESGQKPNQVIFFFPPKDMDHYFEISIV